MPADNDVKRLVKNKYGQIAKNSTANNHCGCYCCSDQDTEEDLTLFKDDYTQLEGYVAKADLGLGCGIPTQFANIKPGDTVVDLGSGAGNDVFVARSIVGNDGKVIGIDLTDEMIAQAEKNNLKMGYSNVEFHHGDIENLPLESDTADVVVSNCVLNLVPDKQKSFEEIYRILKPGAHFCISDIVSSGKLPESLKTSAELYVGCIAGALDIDHYQEIIKDAGFNKMVINKKQKVILSGELMQKYLSAEEMNELAGKEIGIYSITITAYKP